PDSRTTGVFTPRLIGSIRSSWRAANGQPGRSTARSVKLSRSATDEYREKMGGSAQLGFLLPAAQFQKRASCRLHRRYGDRREEALGQRLQETGSEREPFCFGERPAF